MLKKMLENAKSWYIQLKVNMPKSNRRKALDTLQEINDNRNDYILIHYSCESFYEIKDGRTPRVTSVAVRELGSGQTQSFSIHKVAELNDIEFDKVNSQYDECEKQMLKELFDYFDRKKDKIFIHWNMRDINYGFEAIKHRYRFLSKLSEKEVSCDFQKIDLAVLLINIYSTRYASHPRFTKLIEKNKIGTKDFLSGAEEAIAFDNKEYVKLHQSTLRKVDIMMNILDRAIIRKLKTEAKFLDLHGSIPQKIYDCVREKWQASLLVWIVTILISFLLGKFL